jgi:hypothetical protein
MLPTLSPQLTELREKTVRYLKNLTLRERAIIAILFGGLAVFGLYDLVTRVQAVFEEQQGRLAEAENATTKVSELLGRYVKLKAHRDAIEREYRGVEIKEGVYAHLENLVRTKLGITAGFTIKDNPAKDIGRNFEQTTYLITFEVPALEPLVELLRELVNGTRPLLLSRLEVSKTSRGDKLKVELDVVSIKEKPAGGGAPGGAEGRSGA